VEVIGARALPAEALVRLAALEPGARLIDVDPDAAAARVAAHPRVRSCRAMRLPPDRVVLRVRERVPLARLEGAHDGIDREGERVPLTAEEIERLPVVRGDAEAALAALGAAHDAGLELASVEARGRADVLLRPVGDGRAIRVGPDAASELASLARLEEVGLLARFPAGEVDMRFRDRAVLRAFEQEGVRDEQ
jgi:cell division protein FtsQ